MSHDDVGNILVCHDFENTIGGNDANLIFWSGLVVLDHGFVRDADIMELVVTKRSGYGETRHRPVIEPQSLWPRRAVFKCYCLYFTAL